MIQNAADAVKKSSHLFEDSGAALPKNLKVVCAFSLCFLDLCCSQVQTVTRYIKGLLANDKEPSVESDPKPKKIKQFYTIRDVIKEHYRELVEAEIPYKRGEKEYIGHYQRAVTSVLENMTDEEVEAAETILESWNKEGAPADVQLK